MQKDIDYDKMTKAERESLVGPVELTSLHRALKEVGNPRKTLLAIHSTIGKLVEQLDDMLGELASGDEEVIEGGAGLKSKEETDEALSGIKLYKGETLLELTERWKLLQNKLYDEEKVRRKAGIHVYLLATHAHHIVLPPLDRTSLTSHECLTCMTMFDLTCCTIPTWVSLQLYLRFTTWQNQWPIVLFHKSMVSLLRKSETLAAKCVELSSRRSILI